MGWNKVKEVKRRSRSIKRQHGRAGAHTPRPYKEKYREDTRGYMSEWEELEEEERKDARQRSIRDQWEEDQHDDGNDSDDAPVGER